MKHSLLYSAFFIVFLQNCFSQTVSLDTTFGTAGKTTYSFSPSGDALNAIAIQEDNKILVSSLTQYSVNGNIIISRFNSDGTLDLTFGVNGIVETQLVNETGASNLIKLQNDGKIIITGSKLNNSSFDSFDFATMRYNTDGSIDTFFGINGIVITDIDGKGDIGSAVDVQSDNKIIVAGYSYLNTNQNAHVSLVRYLSNGTLDTTFGSNGKLVLSLLASNSYDYTQCIKVLSNDNIIIGASTTALETLDDYHNFGVVKILSNGTVDTAFGNNGSVITDFGAKEFIGAVNEFNGNIIAAGYSTFSGGAKMAIAKYTVNGTLDATFGVNGIFYGNKNESTLYDAITSMKVLNSGKILCSGYTLNTTNADFLLIQFNVDGSVDTGFNSTGYFMTDFANTNDLAGSIDIGPDGKIVCAGLTMIGANYVTGLARYELTTLANVSSIRESFSVYPNPFTDFITITSNERNFSNATIELYDVNGRILSDFSTNDSTNFTIQMVENLAAGNYILKISSGNKIESLKVIKK
jgi:uncharacterized delta-60 repeat protein